ncbi:MAG: DEDD exonuclease domain-containing protein [Actinomycetes bacterium]
MIDLATNSWGTCPATEGEGKQYSHGMQYPDSRQYPDGRQLSLDELGTPLAEITFVVVDLETTGGKPAEGGITEIGAVAVRGGVVQKEMATLVNAQLPLPPMISSLTGITPTMLADAPGVFAAVTTFWEFARGGVLVAHNAPYDIGFLRGAGAVHNIDWPQHTVVDTVTLARRLLSSQEVPNRKLSTLARFFASPTQPVHRALADARATVHVLHGLLERAGSLGLHTLEDLLGFTNAPTAVQHRKRSLAEALPESPGVYVFRDRCNTPLYVGTSVNIRTRVRSYFAPAAPRARMNDMLAQTASVTPIVCATPLEAQVREIRLIAEHQPSFNRRSRTPQRATWVALKGTSAGHMVRTNTPGPLHHSGIGPYASRRLADDAVAALTATAQLPPASPPTESTDFITEVLQGNTAEFVRRIQHAIAGHVVAGRYERATVWRNRMATVLWGVQSAHVLRLLRDAGQITAGRRVGDTWELHVIRSGRLVAAGLAAPGVHPLEVLHALVRIADDTPTPTLPIPQPAGLIEEARLLWRWLTEADTRLVSTDATFSTPLAQSGGMLAQLRAAQSQARNTLQALDAAHH